MVVKEILSLSGHCLHLCNNSNIEEIVFLHLCDADAFVTNKVEVWKKKFDVNGIKLKIKMPNTVKENERIVVDGSSLGKEFGKWEKKWASQAKAICIHNIDELEPSILRDLVNSHDKMFLSINEFSMISDKNLEKEIENLSPEIVENLIKRELRNVVLSLLLSKPMCGTDLVKTLYQKFKVFVSPGMLYPTLHELEKTGLLRYEYNFKNKIYSIQERDRAKILLKTHVRANSLLSQFLENV